MPIKLMRFGDAFTHLPTMRTTNDHSSGAHALLKSNPDLAADHFSGFSMTSSTRRLFARPSALALSASGLVSA